MNNLPKRHGAGPQRRGAPEARGPMRLHRLKAGPDYDPISEQSSLKYLGVILDKLNWKPQIEKMVTQLSKSCGMLFKLKHYTNISVLKSVYVALFHSYSYSILNWGRANKTTLFPLIRLQNKAVITLEYDKTKTAALYTKHKILNIGLPDIKLSVAKFMYSVYNGELPNYFDKCFTEIASVHKYQTRLAALQKYDLPRMKTSLNQLSLKYFGP